MQVLLLLLLLLLMMMIVLLQLQLLVKGIWDPSNTLLHRLTAVLILLVLLMPWAQARYLAVAHLALQLIPMVSSSMHPCLVVTTRSPVL